MMFQLGQIPGQLMGIYLQSLVPAVPAVRRFRQTAAVEVQRYTAQGTAENEIVVAFG